MSDSPVPIAIVLFEPDENLLAGLLNSLRPGNRPLLLYANGPLPEAVESRVEKLAHVRLLRSPVNVGQGAALNALCEAAIGDGHRHLLLLDQDSAPAPSLPETLRARLFELSGKDRRIAAIGPRLIPPDGEGYLPVRYQWLDGRSGEAVFVPTSGCLLALDAYREVGPFRSDFFIGAIDVEWGLRAAAAGYGSYIARDLTMVHRWGSASTDYLFRPQILRHSAERAYFHLRNTSVCVARSPAPTLWRLRTAALLGAQIGALLVVRGPQFTRRVAGRALADGFAGRLGSAPPEIDR